jgi:hypothetical protein
MLNVTDLESLLHMKWSRGNLIHFVLGTCTYSAKVSYRGQQVSLTEQFIEEGTSLYIINILAIRPLYGRGYLVIVSYIGQQFSLSEHFIEEGT